jgi:hypothetical protein
MRQLPESCQQLDKAEVAATEQGGHFFRDGLTP